jgi:hypothetical protein
LKAAARLPSTLPSMVGCCMPTPLSTAPILAAFVQCHAVVAVLAPVFVQSGQRQQRILRRRSARIVRSMRPTSTLACQVARPALIVARCDRASIYFVKNRCAEVCSLFLTLRRDGERGTRQLRHI